MSLERRDVRCKMDPSMFEALRVLADVEQLELGEFVERELLKVVRQRVREATVIASRTERLGISGHGRSEPVTAGKIRESPAGRR